MQNLTLIQIEALESEAETILEVTQKYEPIAHVRIRVDALQRLLYCTAQYLKAQKEKL